MGASNSTPAQVMFSEILPETSEEGHCGSIYCSKVKLDMSGRPATLYEMFQQGLQKASTKPCLGQRTKLADGIAGPYEWMTYAQVYERVSAIAAGLVEECSARRGDFVGVFSKNVPEWVLVEQACNRQSLVLVPLYDTLGPDVVPYIVNHVEMRVLVCGAAQAEVVLQCLGECPTLEYLIVFDD